MICCLDQKMNTEAGWRPLEKKKENNSQKTVRYQRYFFIPYCEFGHCKITRFTDFLLVALNWMDNKKSEAEEIRDYPDSAAKVH